MQGFVNDSGSILTDSRNVWIYKPVWVTKVHNYKQKGYKQKDYKQTNYKQNNGMQNNFMQDNYI